MTRPITSDADSALSAGHVAYLILVELDFAGGTVRLCNATTGVQWDGQTWLGLGDLGRIEPLQESAELRSQGMAFELSGVDPAMLAVALGENYQGRPAKLWLAPLSSAPGGMQLVADPVGPFVYRMDTMEISAAQTATITLRAETRLADWDRPRIRRYTDEDQQSQYPGDKFFNFVNSVQDIQILF